MEEFYVVEYCYNERHWVVSRCRRIHRRRVRKHPMGILKGAELISPRNYGDELSGWRIIRKKGIALKLFYYHDGTPETVEPVIGD